MSILWDYGGIHPLHDSTALYTTGQAGVGDRIDMFDCGKLQVSRRSHFFI
jgi:hypothetical protein